MRVHVTLELGHPKEGAPRENAAALDASTRRWEKFFIDIPEATAAEVRSALPQMFEQLVSDALQGDSSTQGAAA